jgi:hypothetical protein
VRYAILPISLLILLLLGRVVAFYDGTEQRAVRGSLAAALAGVMLLGVLGIAIIEVNAPELLLFAGRINERTYLRRALTTYGSLDWLRQTQVQANIAALGNCSRAYAPDPAKFFCTLDNRKEVARHVALHGCQYLVLPLSENVENALSGLSKPPAPRLTYRDSYFAVYQLTDKP